MKNIFKIGFIVFFVFIVIFGLAWLSRSHIINEVIKRTINTQSNGKISVSIKDLEYKPFDREVLILDFSLIVNTKDSLDTKKTNLKKLSFDSVAIIGFDVFKILFDKEIKAEEVLTAKPKIVLLQMEKTYDSTSFEHHFNSILNGNSKLELFPIEIGIFKVDYGHIMFKSNNNLDFLGSANFAVELHNLNTKKDSLEFDSHSFLYSERLVVDLTNVHKPLKNNNSLQIRKIHYDSKIDRLLIDSLKLGIGNDTTASVVDSIYFGELMVNGLSISHLTKEKDLVLNSIQVRDGYLGLNEIPSNEKTKNNRDNNKLTELFKLINAIKVDSVALLNISSRIIDKENELAYNVNNLSINLFHLALDSSVNFKDVFPTFSKLGISIADLHKLKTPQIQANDIYYSADKGMLSISKLNLVDTLENTSFKSEMLEIKGLEYENILAKSVAELMIIVRKPNLKLDLSSKYFKSEHPKNINKGLLDFVTVKSIDISKANIEVYDNKIFTTSITDLDLNCVLSKKGPNTNSLELDSLQWFAGDFVFISNNQRTQISASSSNYKNETFGINNARIELSNENFNSSINLSSLKLNNFNIIDFSNTKTLESSKMKIEHPSISIDIYRTNAKAKHRDSIYVSIPFEIDIPEILIDKGVMSLKVNSNNLKKNISFSSDFNLLVRNVDLPNTVSLDHLKTIDWELDLNNSNLVSHNFESELKTFSYSTTDSSLSISVLNMKLDSLVAGKKIVSSNDLNCKSVEVKGLDYSAFLDRKKVVFESFSLKDAIVNVQASDNQAYMVDTISPNSLEIGDLEFSKFQFENIAIKFYDVRNDFTNIYELSNLDLLWLPNKEKQTDLIEELGFEVTGLSVLNGKDKSSLSIGDFKSERTKDDIELKGLIFDKPYSTSQNGFLINLPLLSLENIVIHNGDSYGIEIGQLNSDTLILEINNSEVEKEKVSFSARVEALEKYSEFVNKLNVKQSNFKNISLSINDISDSIHSEFTISEVALSTTDVGFTSNDSSILNLSNIRLDIKGRKFITADSLYEISSGDLFYNFKDQIIIIDSLNMTPRYEKEEFFNKFKYQTDLFNIYGDSIVFSGMDFFRAINDKEYVISNVELKGIKFSAHRDKDYPFQHGIIKPMPSDLIGKIPQRFRIDTLRITDSYVLYGEYVKDSKIPGELIFDDFNLKAYNLSNMLDEIPSPPIFNFDIETRIMSKTKLYVDLEIPLNSKGFSFSARSDELDFRDFNSMTENLFGVTITSGKGYIVTEKIYAGDSISTGNMIFSYKKLKLALYDRSKAQLNKGITSPFFKFLVNDLLIKSNNPRFFGRTRTGHVYFERIHDRSFLGYIWKSILSGMMSTAWHNSKEQRKQKRRLKQGLK